MGPQGPQSDQRQARGGPPWVTADRLGDVLAGGGSALELGFGGEGVNLPRRALWKDWDLIETLKRGIEFQ